MDGWINDEDMRSSVFSIQLYSIYILYISMFFCSIVHVLQGFHQPPKRTKTNTLRLAVQRISYLLLRKVTARFGTQEDHFVWDLLRAGGRCFFEMDGTRNSNSQSSALIYRCAINVCLAIHRNQVGQGENNWECINQRYQCFFLQSSLCLFGMLVRTGKKRWFNWSVSSQPREWTHCGHHLCCQWLILFSSTF